MALFFTPSTTVVSARMKLRNLQEIKRIKCYIYAMRDSKGVFSFRVLCTQLCRQFTFFPKQLSDPSPRIEQEIGNPALQRAERREIWRDCSSCEESMLVLTGGV